MYVCGMRPHREMVHVYTYIRRHTLKYIQCVNTQTHIHTHISMVEMETVSYAVAKIHPRLAHNSV